jgi:hypothetical protein
MVLFQKCFWRFDLSINFFFYLQFWSKSDYPSWSSCPFFIKFIKMTKATIVNFFLPKLSSFIDWCCYYTQVSYTGSWEPLVEIWLCFSVRSQLKCIESYQNIFAWKWWYFVLLCNVFLFQETFYLLMAPSCMVCRQMLIVPSFSQTDYLFFLQLHDRCHEHSVLLMSVCLTFPHLVSTQ